MAQKIPIPPIRLPSKNTIPRFDHRETDDDIIAVVGGSESESEHEYSSEPEPRPSSKRQQSLRIETTYHCWKLTKASPRSRETPSWKRAERVPMTLPSDELAAQARKQRKTRPITEAYEALSADQRQHVEILIAEKRWDETHPDAEWELAGIHREVFNNMRTMVRETKFLRVILVRRDKRKEISTKKPIEPAGVTNGSIMDLNDRVRILSLESGISGRSRPMQPSKPDSSKHYPRDKRPKREKAVRVEVVSEERKEPIQLHCKENLRRHAQPDDFSGQGIWQQQPLLRKETPRDQLHQAEPSGPSTFQQAEALQPPFPVRQVQPQAQQHASLASSSWMQQSPQPELQQKARPQQWQSPKPPQPQNEAQPRHLGGQHGNFHRQFSPQQSVLQQPMPSVPQYQTSPQEPLKPPFLQPISGQKVQSQPSGMRQPVPVAQYHMLPQQTGSAAQPSVQQPSVQQPSVQQPSVQQPPFHIQQSLSGFPSAGGQPLRQPTLHQQIQASAPVSITPFAVQTQQSQPGNHAQPQSHTWAQQRENQTSRAPPSQYPQTNRNPSAATVPMSSSRPLAQPPKDEAENRPMFNPEAFAGRLFSDTHAQHKQVEARVPAKEERFEGFAPRKHNESLVDPVPMIDKLKRPFLQSAQKNRQADERRRREDILSWTYAQLNHSRSSSSFEDQYSTMASPEVSSPPTSISGSGYPHDRGGYTRSGYRSFDQTTRLHAGRERVNVLPARSGKRTETYKAVQPSRDQKHHERPVIVQGVRQDRSPAPRSNKKHHNRQEEISESFESDYESYQRPPSPFRGRNHDDRGNHKTREFSGSPKRREEHQDYYGARVHQRDERPSLPSRRSYRPESETASVLEKLDRRLQSIEEKQANEVARRAEEAEKQRREAERKEAYERGVEDAMAWKKSRPSGFPS